MGKINERERGRITLIKKRYKNPKLFLRKIAKNKFLLYWTSQNIVNVFSYSPVAIIIFIFPSSSCGSFEESKSAPQSFHRGYFSFTTTPKEKRSIKLSSRPFFKPKERCQLSMSRSVFIDFFRMRIEKSPYIYPKHQTTLWAKSMCTTVGPNKGCTYDENRKKNPEGLLSSSFRLRPKPTWSISHKIS